MCNIVLHFYVTSNTLRKTQKHNDEPCRGSPYDTSLFNICEFRPDTSWKVIPQERERERLRRRRLHFYPKQRQRSVNAPDRIGSVHFPLPLSSRSFGCDLPIARWYAESPSYAIAAAPLRAAALSAVSKRRTCIGPLCLVEWYMEIRNVPSWNAHCGHPAR